MTFHAGDEKISFNEFPFLMAQIKIVKTDDKESMAHFNMFRSTDTDNDGYYTIGYFQDFALITT